MKKVYTTIFLFVSLFFFYSSGVKANTTTFLVSETEMEYVKNDNFKNLREKLITYCNENNKYYAIYYLNGDYSARVFDKNNYSITNNSALSYLLVYLNPLISGRSYKLSGDSIVQIGGSFSNKDIILIDRTTLTYINFLDTNIENLQYTGTKDFIIQYDDLTYSITNGTHFPNLYEIYLDTISIPDEPIEEPTEEEKILSNFYNLIIEKIVVLSNSMVNNYILLSVLGVFILIFLIKLVGRYLL